MKSSIILFIATRCASVAYTVTGITRLPRNHLTYDYENLPARLFIKAVTWAMHPNFKLTVTPLLPLTYPTHKAVIPTNKVANLNHHTGNGGLSFYASFLANKVKDRGFTLFHQFQSIYTEKTPL